MNINKCFSKIKIYCQLWRVRLADHRTAKYQLTLLKYSLDPSGLGLIVSFFFFGSQSAGQTANKFQLIKNVVPNGEQLPSASIEQWISQTISPLKTPKITRVFPWQKCVPQHNFSPNPISASHAHLPAAPYNVADAKEFLSSAARDIGHKLDTNCQGTVAFSNLVLEFVAVTHSIKSFNPQNFRDLGSQNANEMTSNSANFRSSLFGLCEVPLTW